MWQKRILLNTIYAGLPVGWGGGILAETIKVKIQKLLTIFSLTEKVLQAIFGTLVRRSPLSGGYGRSKSRMSLTSVDSIGSYRLCAMWRCK